MGSKTALTHQYLIKDVYLENNNFYRVKRDILKLLKLQLKWKWGIPVENLYVDFFLRHPRTGVSWVEFSVSPELGKAIENSKIKNCLMKEFSIVSTEKSFGNCVFLLKNVKVFNFRWVNWMKEVEQFLSILSMKLPSEAKIFVEPNGWFRMSSPNRYCVIFRLDPVSSQFLCQKMKERKYGKNDLLIAFIPVVTPPVDPTEIPEIREILMEICGKVEKFIENQEDVAKVMEEMMEKLEEEAGKDPGDSMEIEAENEPENLEFAGKNDEKMENDENRPENPPETSKIDGKQQENDEIQEKAIIPDPKVAMETEENPVNPESENAPESLDNLPENPPETSKIDGKAQEIAEIQEKAIIPDPIIAMETAENPVNLDAENAPESLENRLENPSEIAKIDEKVQENTEIEKASAAPDPAVSMEIEDNPMNSVAQNAPKRIENLEFSGEHDENLGNPPENPPETSKIDGKQQENAEIKEKTIIPDPKVNSDAENAPKSSETIEKFGQNGENPSEISKTTEKVQENPEIEKESAAPDPVVSLEPEVRNAPENPEKSLENLEFAEENDEFKQKLPENSLDVAKTPGKLQEIAGIEENTIAPDPEISMEMEENVYQEAQNAPKSQENLGFSEGNGEIMENPPKTPPETSKIPGKTQENAEIQENVSMELEAQNAPENVEFAEENDENAKNQPEISKNPEENAEIREKLTVSDPIDSMKPEAQNAPKCSEKFIENPESDENPPENPPEITKICGKLQENAAIEDFRNAPENSAKSFEKFIENRKSSENPAENPPEIVKIAEITLSNGVKFNFTNEKLVPTRKPTIFRLVFEVDDENRKIIENSGFLRIQGSSRRDSNAIVDYSSSEDEEEAESTTENLEITENSMEIDSPRKKLEKIAKNGKIRNESLEILETPSPIEQLWKELEDAEIPENSFRISDKSTEIQQKIDFHEKEPEKIEKIREVAEDLMENQQIGNESLEIVENPSQIDQIPEELEEQVAEIPENPVRTSEYPQFTRGDAPGVTFVYKLNFIPEHEYAWDVTGVTAVLVKIGLPDTVDYRLIHHHDVGSRWFVKIEVDEELDMKLDELISTRALDKLNVELFGSKLFQYINLESTSTFRQKAVKCTLHNIAQIYHRILETANISISYSETHLFIEDFSADNENPTLTRLEIRDILKDAPDILEKAVEMIKDPEKRREIGRFQKELQEDVIVIDSDSDEEWVEKPSECSDLTEKGEKYVEISEDSSSDSSDDSETEDGELPAEPLPIPEKSPEIPETPELPPIPDNSPKVSESREIPPKIPENPEVCPVLDSKFTIQFFPLDRRATYFSAVSHFLKDLGIPTSVPFKIVEVNPNRDRFDVCISVEQQTRNVLLEPDTKWKLLKLNRYHFGYDSSRHVELIFNCSASLEEAFQLILQVAAELFHVEFKVEAICKNKSVEVREGNEISKFTILELFRFHRQIYRKAVQSIPSKFHGVVEQWEQSQRKRTTSESISPIKRRKILN